MATADDRTLILDRIRQALHDVPDGEGPEYVSVPRDYLLSHAAGDLPTLFAGRAADYRAGVTRTDENGLPEAIAQLVRQRGIRSLVVPPGFPSAFVAQLKDDCNVLHDEPPLSVQQLDAAGGVVTTAALAVAETGTIVLDGGPGQGRRALTLLPDYHLCVVRADQIVADVPDMIRRLDPARPTTLVSGPSATSDIENTRVEGVHGPRTLDVVIVGPPAPGEAAQPPA